MDLVFSRPRYVQGDPLDLVFGDGDGSFAQSLGITTQFGTPLWVNHRASGFSSTSFGAPNTPMRSFGFRSTEYGRPSLTFAVTPIGSIALFGTPAGSVHYTPSGFSSTAFGAPNTPLFASGFASTGFGIGSFPLVAASTGPVAAFGTGIGKNIQVAVGFTSSTFGTPMVAPIALGFTSTRFGIGSIPLRVTTIPPNTSFGLPFGRHFFKVSGFRSTQFGAPILSNIALGFKPTQFGAPDSRQYFRVMAAFPSTVVSTAYHPINQSGQASGVIHARVGQPVSFGYLPAEVDVTSQAFGFSRTTFGTPLAEWDQFAIATGSAFGSMGTPSAVNAHPATGFQSTSFGTPQANMVTQASGFRPTLFGTPLATTVHAASSTHRATRFGLPTGIKVNARCVYGFTRHGRFGQPRGRTFYPRVPSGFTATLIGSPTSSENHRARHIAPVARFGTPGRGFGGGGYHGHATGFSSTAFGVPTYVDV